MRKNGRRGGAVLRNQGALALDDRDGSPSLAIENLRCASQAQLNVPFDMWRLFVTFLLAAALALAGGCRGVRFHRDGLGKYPEKGAAEYSAMLYFKTRDSGSLFGLQNKDLWVQVEDQSGRRLLNDKLERMRVGMVEGKTKWSDFETLQVELFEVGFENSLEEYAVERAKKGPRYLLTLTYRYDPVRKQFQRVK